MAPDNGLTCTDLDGGLVGGAEPPLRGLHEATLEVGQYAKRDAAWRVHCANCQLRTRYNGIAIGAMHDAFDAGWEARKKADYEIVFGLDKPKAE